MNNGLEKAIGASKLAIVKQAVDNYANTQI